MRIITPTSPRRRAGYFRRNKPACSRFVLEPFLNTLSIPLVNRNTRGGRSVWSQNCIILRSIAIPERRRWLSIQGSRAPRVLGCSSVYGPEYLLGFLPCSESLHAFVDCFYQVVLLNSVS